MRPFLYISPYFPPDSRVGALRPLKFVRHLPSCGYRPVVLADAAGASRDARLEAAVPDGRGGDPRLRALLAAPCFHSTE